LETVTSARFERVSLDVVAQVAAADLAGAWPAWRRSCEALERSAARRALWQRACAAAVAQGPSPDSAAIGAFFAEHFDAWRMLAETREAGAGDSNERERAVIAVADRGRITGYYEPLLEGRRVRDERFRVALRSRPDDLLIVDLSSLHPELVGRRVRGRLVDSPEGRRVVPYYTRAELEASGNEGSPLVWVEDPVEAFFLHVQGSGRVRFPDGSQIRVGYADTNGHPYKSIGRVLIERGELRFEQASMQGIQAWARAHPTEVDALLDENPSYVFFRERPVGDPNAGPIGALNVPLTPGYSLAADPQFVPLGAPVVIETEHPTTHAPLSRLSLVQDTGGAIRGPIRFDFFWGAGEEAGEQAGRQRHDVRAWLLLPKGVTPEAVLAGP
ncbi:murein transglycosylase A, partial [Myxococcota bacterium]|nr:murein transglycosylase A [Myxococcota bacterium]